MADLDRTIDALADLAQFKVGPRPSAMQLAAYAKELAPIPQELIDAALDALKYGGGDFFPAFGAIVKALGEEMTQRGLLLAPDDAWALALRATSRYQPQTRPRVASGNPAVDAVIRDLGGPAAFQFTGAKSAEIQRGRFLTTYATQRATPRHLGWAIQNPPIVPQLVPGVELPEREVARLEADARALGSAPPPVVGQIRSGVPERAIVPDGTVPPPPFALPARLPAPLTPERRAALRAETQAALRRAVERGGMPESDGAEAIGEAQIHQPGLAVRRWSDGAVGLARQHGPHTKEDARADSRAALERRERQERSARS